MEDTVQVISNKPKLNENENKSQKISVCEIMKTNTSRHYSKTRSRDAYSISKLF